MADTFNAGGVEANLSINTNNLPAEFAKITAELQKVEREMKQLASAIDAAGSATVQQKAKLEQLTRAYVDLNAKANSVAGAIASVSQASIAAASSANTLSGSIIKTATAFGSTSSAASTLSAGVINVANAMSKAGSAAATLAPNTISVAQAFGSTSSAASTLSANVINVASAMQQASSAASALAPKTIQVASSFGAMSTAATSLTPGIINQAGAFRQAGSAASALAPGIINATTATSGAIPGFIKMTHHQNETADASKKLGYGLMQLGYVADDIRYGFGAIVNNIAPLVQGLTQNSGLAGAATIAAIAAYQLYQRWDEVRHALGDTSDIEQAKQSIEGLSGVLKSLQADADSFSWGDQIAWQLGMNPDAGKQSQATNMQAALDAKKSNAANAKQIEGHRTKEESETADRFSEAVAQTGGMKDLAGKLGEKAFKQQGAARFLSQDKGSAAGVDEVTQSEAQEYTDLAEKKKSGLGFWKERDASRMSDLEEKARKTAIKEAEGKIGSGLYDKKVQVEIGNIVGGDAGDIIAGRKDTKKDMEKKEEKAKVASEKKEKEDDRISKQNQEADITGRENMRGVAKTLLPDVEKEADRGVIAMDKGASRKEVHAALKSRLVSAGMNEDDASDAADHHLSKAQQGTTPEQRATQEATRVKREGREAKTAARQHDREIDENAEDAVPGIDSLSEQAVAESRVRGPGQGSSRGGKKVVVFRGSGSNLRRIGSKIVGGTAGETTAAAARKQIRARLEAGGLKGKELDEATEKKSAEAEQSVTRKINEKMFGVNAKMATRQANSEMYGTDSLTSKIQSSVGTSGPNAKSETLLQQIVEELKREAGQRMVFERRR